MQVTTMRNHRHRHTTTIVASPRRLVFAIVVCIIHAALATHADASNWAQVSGKRHTNAAVLGITPWAKRHGHAVAALDFSDAHVRATGQKARLFVLGGDSSVQGTQDLRAYPGGGSFKNDVWATTGITWRVETNILKTTKWGDPLPQIIANMSWLQTNSGKKPPRGVTYSNWIACAAAAWAVSPPVGCADASKPPGAYLADNMWSPRRNFVALAFQNELFVLGGRAREHFPLSQAELRGGSLYTNARTERWRERAVLKNDVWRSSDAGASWKLVTPGCRMPQPTLVHKAGQQAFQCASSDQCDGDSSCKLDQATGNSVGVCVCNMWSPREFHAVAVHDTRLFVAGGYALVEHGNCGVAEFARKRAAGEEFACSGGYRSYLHDVWTSRDGAKWELLTLQAAFAPRGEHALVSFQSLLYVLGGRSRSLEEKEEEKESTTAAATSLLNDVWKSTDSGVSWTLELANAPWTPRAKHVVVVQPGATDVTSGDDPDDRLVLLYGEDDERALADVWTWRGSLDQWTRDYGANTAAATYVSPTSSVAFLRGMIDAHVDVLTAAGLHTIMDLTTLSLDATLALRSFMPICDYAALAKEIVATCSVRADVVEGHEYGNQLVAPSIGPGGSNNDAPTAATAAPTAPTIDNWDGCAHVGTKVLDATTQRLKWPDVRGIDQVQRLRDVFDDAQLSICQWHPAPRTGHASVVFQRKLFVLGGLIAPDHYENDVWYRDARRPRAQLTLVPRTKSSDTLFQFDSDKPGGCLFEYHVEDVVERLVVRNWTRSLGAVDVERWLDAGKFRFRVRALDAAGNVDAFYEIGQNEHVWIYVPKLPYALIIGLSSAAFVVLVGFILEWRKRRKRAAMERYAMKRMRKKLKGKKPVISGDANWRETYDKAKDKDGKKKKSKEKTTKGKVVGVKATSTKEKAKDKDKKSTKVKVKDKVKEKKVKEKDKVKEKIAKATVKDKKAKVGKPKEKKAIDKKKKK